jgi:hypothetical protein
MPLAYWFFVDVPANVPAFIATQSALNHYVLASFDFSQNAAPNPEMKLSKIPSVISNSEPTTLQPPPLLYHPSCQCYLFFAFST